MSSLNHFLFGASFIVIVVAGVSVLFCVFPAYWRGHNRAFLYLAFAFMFYIFDALADHTLALWPVPHQQYIAYLVLRRLTHIATVILLAAGVISLKRSYLAATGKADETTKRLSSAPIHHTVMRRTKYWEYLLVLGIGCAVFALLVNLPMGAASSTAIYGIVFLGGLILLWHVFTDRRRRHPRWVRTGLAMGGAVVLCWSLIGFSLLIASARFTRQTYRILDYTNAIFLGIGLGVLLLLVISGEFISFSSGRTKNETDERHDAGNDMPDA
jgi:hypothetical protein